MDRAGDAGSEVATFVDAEDAPTEMVAIDDAPLDADAARYEPLGILGKGGMGEIRLCKDTRIARQVALKVLRHKLRQSEAAKSRFLREARLQGQLEHPAIVPVHDVGTTGEGDLYFTMKRVRGVTLLAALSAIEKGDRTRFSRRRLLTAFAQICLAVDFAHARGVVHRDLKPANIMLGDFGEVYVLDWGIAKVMAQADTPGVIEQVELPDTDTPTRAGTVLGTPRYMAPEQHMGHADARSDVYALGRILFEILTAEPEPPPELMAVATRATAVDADARFASPRELHDAVEGFLDGDRDLEVRKRLADDHVRRVERALERAQNDPTAAVRVEAARDLGRALGMDPGNPRAMRALHRLLADVPAVLPADAQAELERRRGERALRMAKTGVYSLLAILAVIPFWVWLGVRDWTGVVLLAGCVAAAAGFHYLAGNTIFSWQRAASFLFSMLALVVLAMSIGLLGVLPMVLVLVAFSLRMHVVTTAQGFAIIVVSLAALFAPFVLDWLDIVPPLYSFSDGRITISPLIHELPPVPTQVYLLMTSAGAIAIGVIYARRFVTEMRRAEARVAFHAWQLEQMVPPEGDWPAPKLSRPS